MGITFSLEENRERIVKIKVVGVGGGGCNVINRMAADGPSDVEYIAINTDKQDLDKSKATYKVQIGEKLTRGQGAGSKPEVGQKSAVESLPQIKKAIEDADMVFITAGMGGGTGTGAAPVIAEMVREAGILTVGVVTKPFGFEGPQRMRTANSGIEDLRNKVDSLVIIPNDRLKLATGQKITLANAFMIADDVLKQAVQGISDLIRETGFINLDFADVQTIMKNAGLAHMGVGHASGKDKAKEAALMAISSPLMETSIKSARGILINIVGSMDIELDEVEEAASQVRSAVHGEANIIFGAAFDETMEDEMRVTVIATGFEADKPSAAAQKKLEPVAQKEERKEAPAATGAPAAVIPPTPQPEKKSEPVSPVTAPAAKEAPRQEQKSPAATPAEAFYGMLDDLKREPVGSFGGEKEKPINRTQQAPIPESQKETLIEDDEAADTWDAIRKIFMSRGS